MSGARAVERSQELTAEPPATQITSAPRAAAALQAVALGRLPAGASARRDYVRALGSACGNRRAARVLARLIDATAVEAIAQKAAGRPMRAHQLAWELIRLFVPEKSVGLSASKYDAAQVGFRLDGTTIVIGEDVVSRVAKGQTTAVGKELAAALGPLPDPFRQIAGGGVSTKDAPERIGIPHAIQAGAEKAWSKSLPKGKSQEQGGIIVTNKSGDYIFRPGKAGTTGTFSPDRKSLKKDEKLLGILHTHPYSAKEGGHTDVPFSGQDLALMALQLDKISVVRSGDSYFVVASSKEFEARVKSAKSKRKLFDQIKKSWRKRFDAFPGNTKQSAVAATPATCQEFELLYYEGQEGSLEMPRAMVKAYKAAGP